MSHTEVFPVPKSYLNKTHINESQYADLYTKSTQDNEVFWADQAQRLDWFKPWTDVQKVSFHDPIKIQWYLNAKLNVAHNCIDRHLPSRSEQTAILWIPEDPKEKSQHITYKQLHTHVCRLSNLLRSLNVKKGDRVTIYLPMIPEAIYAMLACARIGAIHTVVFGGFSPDSMADRIIDCQSDIIITADEGYRGGKTLPLKANVDKACLKTPHVRHVVVVRRTHAKVDWHEGRDIDYNKCVAEMPSESPAEIMDSEDPLFILYTSGSTNRPKGVLHTTGGYLVYASLTHQYVFDYHDGDVYWCAADVGWITGHSYIVYGPLANGATTVMYEGLPTYPTPARLWEIVDQHQINILYTAPTLIRALISQGDDWVKKTSRKSLRVLGSVGEPINPEAWLWYYHTVGDARCPIVDTWWQTETGGILISPLPGATTLKPGSATRPFFGVEPVLLNDKGQVIDGPGEGVLCIKNSWPGQMRTVYNAHDRFFQTYFSQYPGYYFTGDGCRRDADGYWWITGRVDDVLNVSGHRIGTAEVESALVEHPQVAEAAVVGIPHDIKGQGIFAFVTLKQGQSGSPRLKEELMELVKHDIGSFAKPEFIQWAPGLPKTRSGKIMRRILRKVASNDIQNLGDTSTLADPQVVNDLIFGRTQL